MDTLYDHDNDDDDDDEVDDVSMYGLSVITAVPVWSSRGNAITHCHVGLNSVEQKVVGSLNLVEVLVKVVRSVSFTWPVWCQPSGPYMFLC